MRADDLWLRYIIGRERKMKTQTNIRVPFERRTQHVNHLNTNLYLTLEAQDWIIKDRFPLRTDGEKNHFYLFYSTVLLSEISLSNRITEK